MDLFDLLILALFAVPALLRWVEQSRKRREESVEPTEQGTSAELPGKSEFGRALEEISRMLQHEPSAAQPGSVPSAEPMGLDQGFTREEQFEHRGTSDHATGAVAEAPFRPLKMRKISTPSAYTRERSSFSARTRRIRRQLRHPATLRNIVLLSEVLQPPVALRRPVRR